MAKNNSDFDASSLTQKTDEHSKNINELLNDVKLLKIQQEKVYTTERAEDFRSKVNEITLTSLESTVTYKKISDKVGSQIDKTLADNSWKFKSLWAPIIVSFIISVVGIIVAIWLAKK